MLPLLVTLLLFCSCDRSGSSAQQYAGDNASAKTAAGPTETYDYDADYGDGAPMAMGDVLYEEASSSREASSAAGAAQEDSDGPRLDEKLVYSGSVTVQTLEYDDCTAAIRDKVKSYDGIIQSESETDEDYHWYYDDHVNSSTRTLYLTIRIPSASFYDFLSSVSEAGKVTGRSVNVDNISQAYSDTKTQIEALEIEEKRLLEMMEQAEEIEDMIAVEARLTEVQSDLNLYKTRLRGMDTDVAYSTVSMTVEEVKKYSPTVVEQSFGDRAREAFFDAWAAFVSFLQDLVIILIALLPFLLLFLLIVLAVLLIRKLTAPQREARRLKKEEERARILAERTAREQAAMMRRQGRPPMPPQGAFRDGAAPLQPAGPGPSGAPAPSEGSIPSGGPVSFDGSASPAAPGAEQPSFSAVPSSGSSADEEPHPVGGADGEKS